MKMKTNKFMTYALSAMMLGSLLLVAVMIRTRQWWKQWW